MAIDNNTDSTNVKKTRIYKTDAMLYRLTRTDVKRLYNNNPPLSKTEEMNIEIALKEYLNKRYKTMQMAYDLNKYLGEAVKKDISKRLNCTQEELNDILCRTICSYFYNTTYAKLAESKAFDMDKGNPNLYDFLSYEELDSVCHMKQRLIEHHNANPDETLKEYVAAAENIAIIERKNFMTKYNIDPIAVQIGHYDSDEIVKVSDYLEKKMKQNTKTEVAKKSEDRQQ